MSHSSTDREKFRRLIRSRVTRATQICVRQGAKTAIGGPSLNLIVASELMKLGSAFAIKMGADEDGVARLARGCFPEAVSLARASSL